MEDNKKYVLLNSGAYTCTVAEWDEDTNTPKVAKNMPNGVALLVRNEDTGETEFYAYAVGGRWFTN